MEAELPMNAELLGRAMRRYEWSRVRTAALSAALTLLIPLLALAIGRRPGSAAVLGATLALCVGVFLWRGMGWGAAVPAGLKAGLVPLAFALAAQQMGHVCLGSGCTSLCLPACIAGGGIAGVLVGHFARRSPWPRSTLAGGLVVTVVIGAMGCACVGYSGVLGMLAGTAVTAAAGTLLRRRSQP